MPITKQAIKKLRRDRVRTVKNDSVRKALKRAVKDARKSPGTKTLSQAFATADRALKRGLIHKNKAGRIKSRLAKLAAK